MNNENYEYKCNDCKDKTKTYTYQDVYPPVKIFRKIDDGEVKFSAPGHWGLVYEDQFNIFVVDILDGGTIMDDILNYIIITDDRGQFDNTKGKFRFDKKYCYSIRLPHSGKVAKESQGKAQDDTDCSKFTYLDGLGSYYANTFYGSQIVNPYPLFSVKWKIWKNSYIKAHDKIRGKNVQFKIVNDGKYDTIKVEEKSLAWIIGHLIRYAHVGLKYNPFYERTQEYKDFMAGLNTKYCRRMGADYLNLPIKIDDEDYEVRRKNV